MAAMETEVPRGPEVTVTADSVLSVMLYLFILERKHSVQI